MCMVVGIFCLTACNKEKSNVPESADAVMTINITGAPQGKASGENDSDVEDVVIDYGVYVFNNANILQKFAHYTTGTRQVITDLTTGPKKVVVLINFGDAANYPATTEKSSTYQELCASTLDFSDIPQTNQEVEDSGLPMSGEASVDLKEGSGEGESNKATVQMFRLVSKVRLSGLTVKPAVGNNLPVSLKQLGIMRAVKEIHVVDASNANTGYYEGITDPYAGGEGTYDARLKEIIDNNYDPQEGEVYFYVLPNSGSGVTNDNATLLTFVSDRSEGSVDPDHVRYFPIAVNPPESNSISGTTGTYIIRNTQYALRVTLQHHGTGTEGPGEIVEDADMTVEISINDWYPTIEQEVVWE